MFRPGKPPYGVPPFGPSQTPGAPYGGGPVPPRYLPPAPCGPFPTRPAMERHFLHNRPAGVFERVRIKPTLSPCRRVYKAWKRQ